MATGRILSDDDLGAVCGGAGEVTPADVACLRAANGVAHLFTYEGEGAGLRARMPRNEADRVRVEAANQLCARSTHVNNFARALRRAGGPSRPLASIVLMGGDR
jgi:hypothetical protein